MSSIDILVSEVGPRDGLQSIKAIMPTEAKKAWIKTEAAAGVREIEVASFVPPKLLPQMADAAEIVAYARTIPDLAVVALVPNFKGAENAIKAGAQIVSRAQRHTGTHRGARAFLAEITNEQPGTGRDSRAIQSRPRPACLDRG